MRGVSRCSKNALQRHTLIYVERRLVRVEFDDGLHRRGNCARAHVLAEVEMV